jgi:glycosyltransferase involved in cell wall biosynthesis
VQEKKINNKKVLIFIVAYNAEKHIEGVIRRIPEHILRNDNYEILIIDDSSEDRTFEKSLRIKGAYKDVKLTVISNPINLGYGGNQKVGYKYAIEKGFDIVVLLHGDGQYAPELLGTLLTPIKEGQADIVFGSRMINKREALKGGMPLYKWVGNQILTWILNLLLGVRLAEFHTGYRLYGVDSLSAIPFGNNSNYYDFDTEIIIQCIDTNQRIVERPIPTFYGDEISYVNGFRYAYLILKIAIVSRFAKKGMLTNSKFNYAQENLDKSLNNISITSS